MFRCLLKPRVCVWILIKFLALYGRKVPIGSHMTKVLEDVFMGFDSTGLDLEMLMTILVSVQLILHSDSTIMKHESMKYWSYKGSYFCSTSTFIKA